MTKSVKLSDLWGDVDDALQGSKAAGIKYAIIESHKILEHTLKSQGYPGKTIEKKLYWAGYSLMDDEGIKSALDKRKEVLESFDYQLSDLEAEEVVKLYKKVVHEIVKKEKFGFSDKIKAFYYVYLNPKSIYFWRNLALTFGFLGAVKILEYTEIGRSIIESVIYLSDLAFSWVIVAALILLIMVVLIVTNYKSNKTGIKIKE